MNDRRVLENLLIGRVIVRAELAPGSTILVFADGTRFVREKTFEGVNQAALFDPEGETLALAVLG